MVKPVFVYLVIAIIIFLPGSIYGDIPAQERAALIALYNSTTGDNWVNNDGWKTPPLHTDGFAMPGTEGAWHGITLEGNHVNRIDFINNNLNGTLPSELQNLGYLNSLALEGNDYLTGNIPPAIGNITSLQQLVLSHNQLTGSIPVELANLTNLIYFSLATNQLTGTIPTELSNLLNLKVLRLDSNPLTGSIPAVLSNLTQLEALILVFNKLTGEIPPELGNLTNLRYFYLHNNQLSGSIPSSLGNLSNLTALSLEFNQLTGNIPPELGKLKKLQDLRLRNNKLTNIPVEIGKLPDLQVLYLGYNNITGAIPTELANLSKLYHLGLGNNQLSGEIPTELGNLINLEFLYLNNNTLSGEIPTSLKNLTKLSDPYMDIGYNCLYSNDIALRAWLDSVDPDWEKHQSECDKVLPEPSPPFGEFSTPLDNSTVSSSVPVTGWALGDSGIESVKIYREEEKNLVYIGDGVLVEGARPDIEEAYPNYPMNSKAGWGYMMLTNFLPGGGNGIFKIHAIATDKDGQTTTLGIKTITVDNANAVKPFGAIDTPTQGGTASGSSYINWGWVLTPQPNAIPTDGTTIKVWVDGVYLGHPTYNIYRSDIATLFPGYANSNGAAGYFYLDTTTYENNVHTIQWTAADNAGNTDGIGSRYFTIQNTGSASNQLSLVYEKMSLVTGHWSLVDKELSSISLDYSEPLKVRKGYNEGLELIENYPDDQGVINIEIKELERVEIQLDINRTEAEAKVEKKEKGNLKFFTGFLVNDDCLRPLPIGSSLDTERGIFTWQPGPGFYGSYDFVFIKADRSNKRKVRVKVKILPKHSGPLK